MMNYLNTYRRYAFDINRINEQAKYNAEDFILMSESVFHDDLRLIVEQILRVPVKRHIVLLAGPSSSGKTTCGKKLAEEFHKKGCEAQLVSMDDFYRGIKYIGILPNGKPDFESVEALDIPLIKESLEKLAETGECVIPKYDFKNSCRTEETRLIKLSSDSVIIIEGIHALNPIFSEDEKFRENISKIYISVKQGIKDSEDYILTHREIRCIRRIVRDYKFRRVTPDYMLDMWSEVVDGEKKYIRPYRYTSDFTVNSIHIYEPCIMRNTALELLSRVDKNSSCFDEARHLMSSLERFSEIDSGLVPENSLIREFIGGGSYSY